MHFPAVKILRPQHTAESPHCAETGLQGVQLATERKPFDHHRPATGLGRVAKKHMQAAEMFHKCCGIFADFSQNKEFLLCVCLVSLVGSRL